MSPTTTTTITTPSSSSTKAAAASPRTTTAPPAPAAAPSSSLSSSLFDDEALPVLCRSLALSYLEFDDVLTTRIVSKRWKASVEAAFSADAAAAVLVPKLERYNLYCVVADGKVVTSRGNVAAGLFLRNEQTGAGKEGADGKDGGGGSSTSTDKGKDGAGAGADAVPNPLLRLLAVLRLIGPPFTSIEAISVVLPIDGPPADSSPPEALLDFRCEDLLPLKWRGRRSSRFVPLSHQLPGTGSLCCPVCSSTSLVRSVHSAACRKSPQQEAEEEDGGGEEVEDEDEEIWLNVPLRIEEGTEIIRLCEATTPDFEVETAEKTSEGTGRQSRIVLENFALPPDPNSRQWMPDFCRDYLSVGCACRRFQIVQPLARCHSRQAVCRGTYQYWDVEGVQRHAPLVLHNRRCSFPSCAKPTLCRECSNETLFPPRPGSDNDEARSFYLKTGCVTCNPSHSYCLEHASHATACPHRIPFVG